MVSVGLGTDYALSEIPASAYCEGGEDIPLLHRCATQAETGQAFGVPEPDEVKVSRPVL